MTDREKLIEIVKNSLIKHIDKSCRLTENIVDDLLTEKVTFPPVAFSDNRRERMIELLNGYYEETGLAIVHYFTDEESEMLADYILSDGWIKPPCKVGDTVYTNTSMQGWYMRKKDRPYKAKIVFIGVNNVDNFMNVVFENDNMLQFTFSQIGETVFLTREEAEKALAERKVLK